MFFIGLGYRPGLLNAGLLNFQYRNSELTKNTMLQKVKLNINILLSIAIGCILPLTWLSTILTHASEYLPYGDQWDTPLRHLIHWQDGSFQWSELISQHNESRKLITSSISLLMFNLLNHWSIKAELIVGFFLTLIKVLAITVLFYRSKDVKAIKHYRNYVFAIVFVVLLLLNYSRSTYMYQLWSVTAERTIVDIMFVSMLYTLLDKPGEKWRVAILVFAPLISVYSYSSGLSLTLIAIFIAGLLYIKQAINSVSLWTVSLLNISIIGSYFIGYESNPDHSSIFSTLQQPVIKILEFIVLFLGNTSPNSMKISYQQALIQGIFIVTASTLLTIWLARSKRCQSEQKMLDLGGLDTFGLIILLYVSAIATMSCLARLPMGVLNATRDDYVIHATFGLIGLLALLTHTLLKINPQPMKSGLIIVLFLSCTVSSHIAFLVYKDVANRQIELLENISMFDDCLAHQKNVRQSHCYAQNSVAHPLFFEYFTLATKFKILIPE